MKPWQIRKKRQQDALNYYAGKMREAPTQAEAMLWQVLDCRRFHGFKFERQVPMWRYIVDFYCPELRLIIEVDGGYHKEPQQRRDDAARTKFLCRPDKGHNRLLRFTNEQVLNDLNGVIARLRSFVGVTTVRPPAARPTPIVRDCEVL